MKVTHTIVILFVLSFVCSEKLFVFEWVSDQCLTESPSNIDVLLQQYGIDLQEDDLICIQLPSFTSEEATFPIILKHLYYCSRTTTNNFWRPPENISEILLFRF